MLHLKQCLQRTSGDRNDVSKGNARVEFHLLEGIIVTLKCNQTDCFITNLNKLTTIYKAFTDCGVASVQHSQEQFCEKLRTSNRTFSSNLKPILVLSSSGANSVQPDSKRSPSGSTLDTEVAIASARILDKRIRAQGSVDWSLRRNSEKTVVVRFPSIKSMTAWENQSLNVDVYIL